MAAGLGRLAARFGMAAGLGTAGWGLGPLRFFRLSGLSLHILNWIYACVYIHKYKYMYIYIHKNITK